MNATWWDSSRDWTGTPPTRISPALRSYSPARILIRVDFPAPFAPMSPTKLPGDNTRSSPLRTSLLLNDLRNPSTRTSGAVLPAGVSDRISECVVTAVLHQDASPTRRASHAPAAETLPRGPKRSHADRCEAAGPLSCPFSCRRVLQFCIQSNAAVCTRLPIRTLDWNRAADAPLGNGRRSAPFDTETAGILRVAKIRPRDGVHRSIRTARP